jgi:8-oxo-dGTP pyrophosphatase MutT (NUDIX family)
MVRHSEPVPRPTVRVLLVDDTNPLLLFCAGQHSNGSRRWFTAGGGVQPGESHEQAAIREITRPAT